MTVQKAFLVGTHCNSFHAGKPAEIIGVVFITPDGLAPRAAYLVRFENGDEDMIAVSDQTNYEIISEEDVKNGKIPPVTKSGF